MREIEARRATKKYLLKANRSVVKGRKKRGTKTLRRSGITFRILVEILSKACRIETF